MERHNQKCRSRREHRRARKAPKVPIKTYRWEDIRRARRRGGYPWTHLYKGPFTEKIDPEQFTMEAFRREKSSSPMGRRSDRVDISEVSSWADYSGKTTPTLLQELISEPQEEVTKKSTGRPGSVVIEEYLEPDDMDLEDDVQVKEFHTESAESSDNISQYLDKEEQGPVTSSSQSKGSREGLTEKSKRAKSEETSERKRKLSGESSHSKYSLSKLGMITKLQEAKKKIKVPKISFSTKKSLLKRTSPPKQVKSKGDTKKNAELKSKIPKSDNPVYIYIPLKPQPGETFETKSEMAGEPENVAEKTDEEDFKMETNAGEQKSDVDCEIKEKEERKSPFSTLERGPRVTKKPPIKINPAFKQFLKDVRQLKEKETVEAAVQEETEDPKKEDSSELDLEEQDNSESESPKEDPFEKLFQASVSSKNEQRQEVYRATSIPRNGRSKSAEPANKRRPSMDSSYSRKSLSKLAIVKKLKDASDKIKNAFSMDSLRKKVAKKSEEPGDEQKKHKKPKPTGVVKPGQLSVKPKVAEPVYIHIPLKPREGETDEFSYLADEETSKVAQPDESEPKKEERTDSIDSSSPGSPKNAGIQFIFLTPPSDDEILDEKEPDIPETPLSASDDMVFFSSLKKLARQAVDQIPPEDQKKSLETVREKSSVQEPEPEESFQEDAVEENIVIDVEDGLNETLKTEEPLKSALKTVEAASPVKRVSFKRKPKVSKEENAETTEAPKEEIQSSPVQEVDEKGLLEDQINTNGENGVSIEAREPISIPEEKTDAPLEDYSQRWSDIENDHEYETIKDQGMPDITLLDTGTDPKIVISATEILSTPPEQKKRSFFQFGRLQKDKGDREKSLERIEGSSDTHSSSSRDRRILSESSEQSKENAGPNKFQMAFKQGTEQIKTKTNEIRSKIHSMKKPDIHLPKMPEFKKPDLKRLKIQKPKINLHLPKIPDRASLHIPHISFPGTRKSTQTGTVEQIQSTGDDSEEPKRSRFSFSGTFPRFKKSKKSEPEVAVFGTMPRTTTSTDSSVRIPLHSEQSMDADVEESLDLTEQESEFRRNGYEHRETSADIVRSMAKQGMEDDYERENQAINRADYLSRWQHGNFRDLDEDNEDERIVGQLVEQRFGKRGEGYNRYENEPTGAETLEERLRRDEQRPKYVSDEEEEFDLRLMQQNRHIVTDLDNLEDDQAAQGYSSEGSGSLHKKGRLGKLDIDSDEFFVVHEIREGFQTPANALAQMNEYDPIGSNRSLPTEIREEPIRKSIKKPKRKKTPHVSREEIPGDEESDRGANIPSRPRRRSKKNKKKLEEEIVVPYQETIPLDTGVPYGQRLDFPRESLGILGDDERDEFEMYENERMVGKEQPDILVTDPYTQTSILDKPSAPTRKHRSLKSLTQSENEFILTDNPRYDVDTGQLEDQIVLADQVQQVPPPERPSRRSRSHTSSLSRISLPPSQRDTDSVFTEEASLAEVQKFPEEEAAIQPCAEEPCVQELRDYMGYAIVDRTQQRDPPLPPPRTPPRRRKRQVDAEEKFATVPRSMGMNQPPVRPLRNYSTLGQAKHSRSSSYDKENKENADSHTHIDRDDLESGEVVQKMRQRPLPAPPRPPRKPKSTRSSLQDITSKDNIMSANQPEEETVSTQTEPLPDDFVCEEIRQESTDTVITPRVPKPEQFQLYDPRSHSQPEIRRELMTPTSYTFEETVTHGTLLVQPLDGAKVVPDHQLSRERLVPIAKEVSDDEETSEIPESFRRLANPKGDSILKAEKLQVSDLDVDRLTVNQLQASKLVVSEIDATTISTNEIDGKSGLIKLGGIQLPPELLERLMHASEASDVQKKTPISEPLKPTRPSPDPVTTQSPIPEEVDHHSKATEMDQEVSPEPPLPPPRSCTLAETTSVDAPPRKFRRKSRQESPNLSTDEIPKSPISPLRNEMLEPDIDDQPPPRPPQPLEGLYLPSQPPASFYALRAKQLVDENIPTAPRRKRHHSTRSRPISRSRSTSDDSSVVARPSRLTRRLSESSIPELSGRLVQAVGSRVNNALKRLIYHLTANLLRNADGNQDLHVFMVILLVLIAGLILLGYGEDRTVIHLHHWEYFNPPRDI